MTIDYETLVADKRTEGSVKNWVNNSLVPSATVITMAEQFIYRKLRVRQMLTLKTGNMVVDNDFIVVPDRYVWPRVLWISGTERAQIKHKLVEDVEAHRAYDVDGDPVPGKPAMFWASETRINFERPADQAYPYRFWHYAQPAALDGQTKTNFLTDRHPLLFTSACLWAANLWLRKGSDALYYMGLADKEITVLNEESDAEQGRDLDMDIVVE